MNQLRDYAVRGARFFWALIERYAWWLIGIGLALLVLTVFALAALIIFGGTG